MSHDNDLAAAYFDHLKNEGYVPNRDGNLIRFKREGMNYVIVADPNDPTYFRLILPNFWSASDDAQRREAYEAMAKTSSNCKVAKLFISDEGAVSSTVEIFSPDLDSTIKVMDRCISATISAARNFVEAVQS